MSKIDPKWLETNFQDLIDIRPLNSGGQKLVFSATHPIDGAVVLKIILPHQKDEAIAREVSAVEQVQSERVPRILESGKASTPIGDCFWFREERILGETVRECLRRGSLSTKSLLRLGLHTLEALVKAEQVNIVHRDVKPENIICAHDDSYWLIDFGIARHLELSSLTETSAFFGKFTVGYAPPEQFRNFKRDIDTRSDLFALGVTLYECATGINPFRYNAVNDLEMLRRVENHPLPNLSLSCSAADNFCDLVAAMTQKRRDHRPSSAHEALAWIQEICLKEQVT